MSLRGGGGTVGPDRGNSRSRPAISPKPYDKPEASRRTLPTDHILVDREVQTTLKYVHSIHKSRIRDDKPNDSTAFNATRFLIELVRCQGEFMYFMGFIKQKEFGQLNVQLSKTAAYHASLADPHSFALTDADLEEIDAVIMGSTGRRPGDAEDGYATDRTESFEFGVGLYKDITEKEKFAVDTWGQLLTPEYGTALKRFVKEEHPTKWKLWMVALGAIATGVTALTVVNAVCALPFTDPSTRTVCAGLQSVARERFEDETAGNSVMVGGLVRGMGWLLGRGPGPDATPAELGRFNRVAQSAFNGSLSNMHSAYSMVAGAISGMEGIHLALAAGTTSILATVLYHYTQVYSPRTIKDFSDRLLPKLKDYSDTAIFGYRSEVDLVVEWANKFRPQAPPLIDPSIPDALRAAIQNAQRERAESPSKASIIADAYAKMLEVVNETKDKLQWDDLLTTAIIEYKKASDALDKELPEGGSELKFVDTKNEGEIEPRKVTFRTFVEHKFTLQRTVAKVSRRRNTLNPARELDGSGIKSKLKIYATLAKEMKEFSTSAKQSTLGILNAKMLDLGARLTTAQNLDQYSGRDPANALQVVVRVDARACSVDDLVDAFLATRFAK
jgi:hypothetical protein